MVARVTDKVVFTSPCVGGCNTCPHPGWTGMITKGSGNATVNSLQVARRDDTGTIFCPHGGTFKIVQGSTDSGNGTDFARVNDPVQCQKCGAMGKIVSGSTNVFVNKL